MDQVIAGPIKIPIRREVKVFPTARLLQMNGMFDVPPMEQSVETWTVEMDLPQQWNIGVIVGPSGCGKSTIARELFLDHLVESWEWPADKCILDGFPAGMPIKDITGLLSSVGFSSPPSWVRPFRVLSNGQQFRVNLARTLAELPDLAVVDEFTSVVDRTVAQIGSAAVAKAVRRRNQKFIAVTCHYDVLEWLEPDWVYEPHTGKLARGRLHRRPPIELEIVRCYPTAWKLFEPHHYLTADLHKSAHCYMALYRGQPAAFCAVIHFPHAIRPGWKEHRTVCLPDFQGVGIGSALSDYLASVYKATGKPYRDVTSHPAHFYHRKNSPHWVLTRAAGLHTMPKGSEPGLRRTVSLDRLTYSFEYTGPARPDDARGFGLNVKV